MKQKPRWTMEMLTAALAVLCALLTLVLLIQRPSIWPVLLALVHWIAPSVRALSHSSLKLQLQFGVDGSAGFYRIEKSGTLLRLKAE